MYGIFTYIWWIFMVNVGKYTSPMDPMGKILGESLGHLFFFRSRDMIFQIHIEETKISLKLTVCP